MQNSWFLTGLLAAAGSLVPGMASAQVGSGWVQYQPPSVIHLDGANGIEVSPGDSAQVSNAGASFSNAGGIETFELHNNISNRAERRIQNTYLGGRRQFEGEVRVSPPTNDESVQQIFGGNSGATTQMIRAFDEGGGTLKKMPGSVVVAEKIHGVWVKVNVIHDVDANTVKTYIDGKLVTTGDGEAVNAGSDGWYHKYGCYGTLRTPSAKVEWRNVKHFRDGSPPAGDAGVGPAVDAAAPAPDGGSADAEGDAAGGEGGSRGSGGAGGGGAAGGGAAGSGGANSSSGGAGGGGTSGRGGGGGSRGGQAGAGPSSPAENPDAGGCSCRAGGRSVDSAPIASVLLAWLWLRLGSRRRGATRPGRTAR